MVIFLISHVQALVTQMWLLPEILTMWGEKIREREKGLNKNVSSVQNTSGAVGSNLTVSNIRNTIA